MAILRRTLGLAPDAYRADERLKELTFGSWEGLTWREVRAREARLAAERERDKWSFVPPGGGESYAMLVERVAPAIAELERATLIVAHGGVARALLASLTEMPPSRAAVAAIWQGRVLTFENGRDAWH